MLNVESILETICLSPGTCPFYSGDDLFIISKNVSTTSRVVGSKLIGIY